MPAVDDEADARKRRIRSLRLRAEEARTAGEQMHYPATRQRMLRIADTYDKVANGLEFPN